MTYIKTKTTKLIIVGEEIYKEKTVYSFSVRGFVRCLKREVKRFFAWVHRGLVIIEDRILVKLDKIGKRAEEKIAERLIGE